MKKWTNPYKANDVKRLTIYEPYNYKRCIRSLITKILIFIVGYLIAYLTYN